MAHYVRTKIPESEAAHRSTSARYALPRFIAVGCGGFLVDWLALTVAVNSWGADLYQGRVVSYLAAATTTWVLNRHFTFRDRTHSGLGSQWARFLAANAIGGGVNYLVYAALITRSAAAAHYPVIGVACGSLTGLFVNFELSRRLVFHATRSA